MITRASAVSSRLKTVDIPQWMYNVSQFRGNTVIYLRQELIEDKHLTQLLILSIKAFGYLVHRNGIHWLIVSREA